jgi:hypothetical protein
LAVAEVAGQIERSNLFVGTRRRASFMGLPVCPVVLPPDKPFTTENILRAANGFRQCGGGFEVWGRVRSWSGGPRSPRGSMAWPS